MVATHWPNPTIILENSKQTISKCPHLLSDIQSASKTPWNCTETSLADLPWAACSLRCLKGTRWGFTLQQTPLGECQKYHFALDHTSMEITCFHPGEFCKRLSPVFQVEHWLVLVIHEPEWGTKLESLADVCTPVKSHGWIRPPCVHMI